MNRNIFCLILFSFLTQGSFAQFNHKYLVGSTGIPKTPSGTYLSPSSIDFDETYNRLYIATGASGKILICDIVSNQVSDEIKLSGSANGICNGSGNIYVASGGYNGNIYKIDAESLEIRDSIRVGHTPVSPILSEGFIYVCNRFSNTIAVIDTKEFSLIKEIPVIREPHSIVGNQNKLYVVNHLPAGSADNNYAAAAVSVINTAEMNVESNIFLPIGSTAVKDICLSPAGEFAYVTHLLSRYQMPTTQLNRGWVITNAISVIDVGKDSLVNTVLLDDIYQGAANPWGITISQDGESLLVTHSGTHEISIIKLDDLHKKLEEVSAGKEVSFSRMPEDVKHDLGFLGSCRTRVKLLGKGPRELIERDGKIYIGEYYSSSLGIVTTSDLSHVQSIQLGIQAEPDIQRKGEMYYYDASLCYQNWLSCASCHPDARTDALNWDLGNDGYGSLRQTKSHLFSHITPPSTITGIRPGAFYSVRAGFESIEFTQVDEEICSAVDTFLMSLKPELSPFLVDGRLSPMAKAGMDVFRRAKCISCHNKPAFTDMRQHFVGNGYTAEEEFDTPTLIETWRTAPYLHNGRAADLTSMFTEHNYADLHGETSSLSPLEVEELSEYVKSISSLAPYLKYPIDAIHKLEGFNADTINLTNFIFDPDSKKLQFQVSSDHKDVVSASISQNLLIIQEQGPGSAIITITAEDGLGGFVDISLSFNNHSTASNNKR
jgi:YVTN family beta-propeller protein